MTADKSKKSAPVGSDDGVTVWEAIQTFETILEVFPEDVSALESLAVAYEQAGDAVRAREKTLLLARLLAAQHDWDRVQSLTGHLLELDPNDDEAALLNAQSQETTRGGQATQAGAQLTRVGTVTGTSTLSFDLRGELELAWFLLQHNMITQEQYEAAIEGLTESRMNPSGEACLSLLYELKAMDRVDMGKIIDFLCVETNTPFIDLTRFEISEEMISMIPLGQCKRLGILPFEKLGREVMVAVMNPVDREMRGVIANFLSTRIHIYLTGPDQFQAMVSKLEANLKKRAGVA